jgi:lysylphosphatidylglycerol synthetase-like protein (DUF2156 family)
MGKRSRKRADGPVRAPAAPAAPRPSAPVAPRRPGQSRFDRYVERADARPKPPWHPVPLIEVSVLAGIVLIVVGLINHSDRQGRLAVVFGVVLASLAGLDTAVREHYSGYRSHSALLAGTPTVIIALVLGILRAAPVVILLVAAGVFALGFFAFRAAFKRRAGVGFRV